MCGVTLVGGGELIPAFVTVSLTMAPCLVAADGGADAVLALGRVPEAVIGDLDSLSGAARQVLRPESLHLLTEQDTTDFDKCLRNIDAPFVVALGFTGARIDHALAAAHTLVRHPDRRCIMVGPADLCFVCPAALHLRLPVGTRFSLFPMAALRATSVGLRWPLDGLAFAPDRQIGTSNETSQTEVYLTVDHPAMLVILPLDCLAAVIAALTPETGAPAVRGE
jgi:thiamine pyrophosphokinase